RLSTVSPPVCCFSISKLVVIRPAPAGQRSTHFCSLQGNCRRAASSLVSRASLQGSQKPPENRSPPRGRQGIFVAAPESAGRDAVRGPPSRRSSAAVGSRIHPLRSSR